MYPKEFTKEINRKKRNFVYEGNISFFRYAKILGFFPIKRTKSGEIKHIWWSFFSIYACTISLIGSVSNFFIIWELVKNIKTKNFLYEDLLTYYSFFTFPVLQFMCVITLYESPKLGNYLSKWDAFEVSYENTVGQEISKRTSYLWILGSFISVGISALVYGVRKDDLYKLYMKYNLNPTTHNATLQLNIYCGIFLCNMYFLWYLLNNCVKHVAELLICEIESLKWKHTKKLDNYNLVWMHIRYLCEELGRTFSVTFVYFFLVMFCSSLPLAYVGVISALQGNLIPIIPAVNCVAFFSLFADIGHTTVEKVGTEFKLRLNSLLLNGLVSGYEKEIVEFIKTIEAQPPVINIAGYFQMNRSYNVSVISSILTYVIILIQLK